jgi:hypothetical protein
VYSDGGDKISSPQGIGGDDRCGVYMIMQIVKDYNCSVLFTEDEEIGCIGANKFVKALRKKEIEIAKVNYMIELDRKGANDAVFYECDNPEFERFILQDDDWELKYGSYTDIVELEPEKKTKVNHIETIKEIARHLGTIIEKIDSLDFCPICWEDSFALLYELRDTVEQIDKLSEQLEPIFSDDSFWNDPQNKDIVENIEEADKCFIEFSSHFSRIDSVLEEEGPKEWYDKDYEYLSAQLKKAKQHLDQILK